MIRFVAVLLVLTCLLPVVQENADRALAGLGPEPDVSSVWTGPVVRAFSLGFSDFLADVYWLRAVQYYGRQKRLDAPTRYADLQPLLETAAELDPRFEIVYRYGAVFLSESHPIGAGKPEEGVAFLRKGGDRNPQNWRLRQDQGLFEFFYMDDSAAGAKVLGEASKIPGAPPWMKPLAAQILASGGELDAALQMWTLLYQQSEPGFLRDNASDQIQVVRNRMAAREIQRQVEAYRAVSDDRASSLAELARRGVVATDRDLARVEFDFDPSTGRVDVSRNSPLWRRPTASRRPPKRAP